MTKRKLKPMISDLDTAQKLRGVFGDKIYNDLIIIDNNKIFITTTAQEVKDIEK